MENFLLIAGAKGSGKGLIRGLLDGHPELFVSPFHELIFDSFYEDDPKKLIKKKDIEYIREKLASKSKYYQLERLSYEKKRNVHLAGGIREKGVKINFDFYHFDRSWVKELHKTHINWTNEYVCKIIYRSFSKNFSSPLLKKKSKKKYFCSLSGGDPYNLSSFINSFKKSKIIYLKRDPIEIIGSLIKRKESPYNSRSKWFSRDSLYQTYATPQFIKSILQYDYEAEKIKNMNKNKILIVDFSNFFNNVNDQTLRIQNFLNISNNKALRYFSNSGYEMTDDKGKNLLTKKIDSGLDNLDKNEIKKIRYILAKNKKKFL